MTFHPLQSRPYWLLVLFLAGCMFHQLGHDLDQARQYTALRGSVRTEHPSDLPILVLVYAGEVGREQLVDYFVRKTA